MQFQLLAEREEFIPVIARWYFDQWGHLNDDATVGKIVAEMEIYTNHDSIPLIVLATEGSDLLGVAQLKYHEMKIYPDKEHWLGGVYVAREHRGRGIASLAANKIADIARDLGVKKLHLQTERLDGGLYARLGWRPLEQVNYRGLDVLVMERGLNNQPAP